MSSASLASVMGGFHFLYTCGSWRTDFSPVAPDTGIKEAVSAEMM